jgi:hypothetical protein
MEKAYTSRAEREFSIEWARQNPELFATSYNNFFREYADGWIISSKSRAGFLTLIAEPVSEDGHDSGAWLRAGSLLYRLTDGPRPENRDEINVTMAQGSRDSEKRECRARQLMDMLDHSRDLKQALAWALEWIDAVPEDLPLPAMPGFDRDYVNELMGKR